MNGFASWCWFTGLAAPGLVQGVHRATNQRVENRYDVVTTLRRAGHEVKPLGVFDELKPIRDQIETWKPDVVLTLLEEFHGVAIYDQNVASFLELMRVPIPAAIRAA